MNNNLLTNDIPQLVAFITSEIRTRADKKVKWAKFKNENMETLREMIGLPDRADCKPGDVMGFDIDDDKNLILLNYTGSAHNVLHSVEGGWTPMLRQMRGLVYEFGSPGDPREVKLVSRGFEKFFNFNEMPQTRLWSLLKDAPEGEKVVCREKADGHMIEYFCHNKTVNATTRGKFGTASSILALKMFSRANFIHASVFAKKRGHDLMSIVVELVHPDTEVHVDYKGKQQLFLLAAYDTSGHKICLEDIEYIASEMPDVFTLPKSTLMTVHEIVADVQNRTIQNNEGWVASIGDQLIKFKYETYIGMMVESKLSYKYIMNCMKNDRLDKMLSTLPEEIREVAYRMVDDVKKKTNRLGYQSLYTLYNEKEGGNAYFKTVCREYWRSWSSANA
jgi:hypothetical protein